MTRYTSMDRLVDELKGFAARGFPESEIHDYLAGSLIDPASLDRYVHECEDHYTRNLVHKDEDFELLVICWGPGHRAPIHGHEGELCFARVERGTLRFSNYELVSESPVRLEPRQEPIDGTTGFLDGPAEIHAVENLPRFGGGAASLHVYSRPYAECDIYDSAHGPKRRVKLAYDSLYGKPVDRNAS